MKARAVSTASAIAIMARAGTLANIPARQSIFHQGDRARAVYFIRKGIVMVAQKGKRRRAVISLVSSGSFLNEYCLLGHETCLWTATTITACSVVEIRQREFTRMLREEPVVSELFQSALLSHIIHLAEDLRELLVSTSEQRLAGTLTRLAQLSSGSRRTGQVPWIDQQSLADVVGTTRSRINFFMNRFRRCGFISYKRDVRIRKSLKPVA